jgi:membrane protein
MKGWKHLYQVTCRIWHFVKAFAHLWNENQVSIRAAALTYTFILGLVPALALCFVMFSFFADFGSLQIELKTFLLKNLATGTGQNVAQVIEQGLKNLRFKTIGYWGLGGLMLTGLLLLAAIQDSMNRIWQVKVQQRMWVRFILFQSFFALGPVSVALTMAVLAFVSKYFPKFFYPAQLASVLLCTLLFTSMYKILPAAPVKWKNALLSGLLAAIAIECAKRGFAVYTAKTMFYSKVYGAIAVLPFFLIWIYLNWTIFLSGTQLNYMLDKGIGLTDFPKGTTE